MIINDTFTDADGTLLDNHTADDGGSWTRHPVSTAGVDFIVASNRIWAEDGMSIYYHSAEPSSAQYDVVVDFNILTSPAGDPGIVGRLDTADETFYLARYNAAHSEWELWKAVAGTYTLLSESGESLGDGAVRTVTLQIRDAAKKILVDGVEVASSTDNSITAAGMIGVRHNASGNTSTSGTHLDNLSATLAGLIPGSLGLFGVGR